MLFSDAKRFVATELSGGVSIQCTATKPGDGGGPLVGPGSYSPRRNDDFGRIRASSAKAIKGDQYRHRESRSMNFKSPKGVDTPGPGAYGHSVAWDECASPREGQSSLAQRPSSGTWSRAARKTSLSGSPTLHGGVLFSPTRKSREDAFQARVGPGAYLSLSPNDLLSKSHNVRVQTGNASARQLGEEKGQKPKSSSSKHRDLAKQAALEAKMAMKQAQSPPQLAADSRTPSRRTKRLNAESVQSGCNAVRAIPYIKVKPLARSPSTTKKLSPQTAKLSSTSGRKSRNLSSKRRLNKVLKEQKWTGTGEPRALCGREHHTGDKIWSESPTLLLSDSGEDPLASALKACDEEVAALLNTLQMASATYQPANSYTSENAVPGTPLQSYSTFIEHSDESCPTPRLFTPSRMDLERFYFLGNSSSPSPRVTGDDKQHQRALLSNNQKDIKLHLEGNLVFHDADELIATLPHE